MRGKLIRPAALVCLLFLLASCGAASGGTAPEQTVSSEPAVVGTLTPSCAEQFAVTYYDDGSALITIAGTDRYLLLPEGAETDERAEDAVVIRRPLRNVYLAASSAMDLFLQLDALSDVRFTSTTRTNWSLPEVVSALDAGAMRYAGKYSAPDFEMLLTEDCSLAVESTMIYHSPDIQEKLESLGIPVMVERSSYETDPLGRVEWIRLYGLLLDREEEADAFFQKQVRQLSALTDTADEGCTAAFFHINTSGAAVIRKPGDYVTKMIEMAGGTYAFSDLPGADDNALSTMNIQIEQFYESARDADVLIYNSTIDGELATLEQLLEKLPLLSDFRAVQSGNVWCTEQSMFQKSSAAAGMIREFNAIFTGTAEDQMTFLHRLR